MRSITNDKINILTEHHEKLMNRLSEFSDKRYIFKNCKPTIWEAFQIKGWYEYLVNNNIEAAKQSFFDCAKADIWYYKIFTENVEDLFSYGRTHVLQTSLSDDSTVMREYSQIDYQVYKNSKALVWQSELASQGEGHIYCTLINTAMNRNLSELSSWVRIAEDKYVPRKGNEWMKLDLDFFQGLIEGNKDKVHRVIEILCTSEHDSRNQHSWIYKDLISQPAQGYAKIAWLNGMEIEIKNPLIHNDLLPIRPNRLFADNVKDLISKMTLQSEIKGYNGQKLSETEYQELYS